MDNSLGLILVWHTTESRRSTFLNPSNFAHEPPYFFTFFLENTFSSMRDDILFSELWLHLISKCSLKSLPVVFTWCLYPKLLFSWVR